MTGSAHHPINVLSRSHSALEFMLTCAVTMTRNNEGEKAEEWKSPENSYVPQTYFYAQREEVSYAKFHSFLYTDIHKYIFSYIRYTYLQTYIYIQLV